MSTIDELSNRVIVITGAARGIGLATATMAAARGARVALCDLEQAKVDVAAQGLRDAGHDVVGIVGDVSNPADVARGAAAVMGQFGQIDVLINNAAINAYIAPERLTFEAWQRELDVCLTGPFLWAQSVANLSMIPARAGSIVNIGSGAAVAAIPRMASYVAAKHGLVGLTRSLAMDWGQYGIRVNCVCPGLTFTELARQTARSNPEMIRQRETRIPLGKGSEPEDVAQAILFLAADSSAGISGQVLNVDGGTLAMHAGYNPPRGEG